jgi:hypothetical protein
MSMTVVPERHPRPVPLTKRDLDREIERLVESVAHGCLEAPGGGADEELRPRWIRPADLIRRVLPFTSRN